MAAKNIKTRNLTNSISKVLTSSIDNQNTFLRGFEDGLAHKEITPEYVRKESRHDEFVATIKRQVHRATSNVNVQQARYNELLADRLTMKSGNATEELLAETRATKTWNRIERDLNGKDKKNRLSAIQNRLEAAIKKGDHSTVAAINSEAPHYLHSIGVKDPEQIIEGIIRTHDSELNAAYGDILEAEKLKALTLHNTEQIVKTFDKNINSGLKDNLNELGKVDYYIEPSDALDRGTIDETKAALKAALEEQQSTAHSTDTSDENDSTYNPDAAEANPEPEEQTTESRFTSTEPTSAPGLD